MTSQAYLKILQITDMHILRTPRETLVGIDTEHYFHAVLDLAFANQEKYDFVLVTGDLAQAPCKESYGRILACLEALNIPCACLPGNHDDFALMQKILNTKMVNCRRQILLGNWQFICLNSQIIGSAGGRLEKPELLLLDKCLTEYPNHHTLIAVHHHCLDTDSVWMDTMTIQNSDEFFEIVKRHAQIRVITTGHIHQLMDTELDGIRILGTPSTCFQFRPKSAKFGMDNTPPGYRVLHLYEDGRVESEIARLAEPLSGLQDNTKGY
ncbi:3',5'-cyclic-AMP phosphodiesterase [Patescibacteria group bacterium]|nr:3',5'-cyclic-AMP phosphodiesterase [Patescibacteria group bacterium]